jgi:hypothetical protein
MLMKLFLVCFFNILLFLCNSTYSQSCIAKIDSIIQQVTPLTYSLHFDSLRTAQNHNRKVQPGDKQTICHDACRDYIYRQLCLAYGHNNVYLHRFSCDQYGGLTNVIACKQGKNPDAGIVIVGAHYDSNVSFSQSDSGHYIAPGANDNGTGVAAVLEIARVLANIETQASIIFAAWDCEEKFLNGMAIGSNAWYNQFVKKVKRTQYHKLGNGGVINKKDVFAYINFDMFGNPADSINGKPVLWACYAYRRDKKFVEHYCALFDVYAPQIETIPHGPMRYSDHTTFSRRRIKSVENLQSNYHADTLYHTKYDHIKTPGNIHFDFTVHVTRGALAYLLNKELCKD